MPKAPTWLAREGELVAEDCGHGLIEANNRVEISGHRNRKFNRKPERSRFTCWCSATSPPPVTHTLEYGRYQELGSISCISETVGIMRLDNNSGHFFSVSRRYYLVG